MKNHIDIIKTAKKLINEQLDALNALENRIDENFENVVKLISNGKGRLIIIGLGKSGIIGRKIAATLNSTGTLSSFIHDSDALHGDLGNIKISYIGDGNNIVHSWLELCMILPLNFTIICPETFKPDMDLYQSVKDKGLSNIEICHDPFLGIKDSDVIYTDVWASMGQKEEADKRRKIFEQYQVNTTLMQEAKSDAIFMHCLPAERGVEVTDAICDSPNSVIFDQAENRMHAQNAIILRLMQVK